MAFIAGCGSSGESSPAKLSLKITEEGKKSSYQVPKSATGGLMEVRLTNQGKAPHGVEFIQYIGNHTEKDALKMLGGNGNKIPSWIKFQGGIGSVPSGQTETADVNVPAGNYVLADAAAFSGPSSGPPATAPLKLTAGSSGDLPSTPATVTAANPAKDKYKWEISGLKTGKNRITFNSKGKKKAVHLIFAVPVKGKAPPLSQIKKDLASHGPPPSYVNAGEAQSTAILDGGASQTTTLDLKKPGQYIFFCPLTDRDGGKPHFEEGLLAVQTIK